jgi:hypothetical protein
MRNDITEIENSPGSLKIKAFREADGNGSAIFVLIQGCAPGARHVAKRRAAGLEPACAIRGTARGCGRSLYPLCAIEADHLLKYAFVRSDTGNPMGSLDWP